MNHVDWIIVGLGNPGAQYMFTRHNVGFMVIDALDEMWPLDSWHEDAGLQRRIVARGNRTMMLIKPLQYMNRSGESLAPTWRRSGLPISRLIVIHDDKDLAEGKLRLRIGGGDGGHKGVRSIIECLGDTGFIRVRIGIGGPAVGVDTSDYVLERIGAVRRHEYEELAKTAAQSVEAIIYSGLLTAMNRFNRSVFIESGKERLP